MSKSQKVELVFEKNGTNWGLVSDTVRHTIDLPIPEMGFDQGVHLVGAKVNSTIHTQKGKEGGATDTGWINMVANVITDQDVRDIVGSVLTIVDATITDKDQRKAFKSLIKQAIYNRYSNVTLRSGQVVGESGYRIDAGPDGITEPTED